MPDAMRPDGRVLRRVSSIILNSPITPGRRGVAKVSIQAKAHSTQAGGKSDWDMEIVPDSEEERRCNDENERGKELVDADIIEISSDEEDSVGSCEKPPIELNDPFVSKIPGAWPVSGTETMKAANVNGLPGQDWAPQTPRATSKLRRTYRSRMIIQSSSSEGSDHDHQPQRDKNIIELSDSSPEKSPKLGSRNVTKPIPAAPKTLACCSGEEDSCSDDGAILTL